MKNEHTEVVSPAPDTLVANRMSKRSRSLSSWQRFVPLLQKELRETLRDRRTIATLFLMPLLVYPILSLLLQNFLPGTLSRSEAIHFRIVVASSEGFEPLMQRIGLADRSLKMEANLPELKKAEEKFDQLLNGDSTADDRLPAESKSSGRDTTVENNATRLERTANENPNSSASDDSDPPKLVQLQPEELDVSQHSWTIYDGDLDLEEVVAAGEIDLAIRFLDLDVDEKLRRAASLGGKAIELIYNEDNEYSRRAAQYVAMRIERSNLMESQVTLQQLRIPRSLAMARLEKSVRSSQVSSVSGLATFIPLILIMMTITGAVYPAIDLTAGERERGTLESLVAAPVSRMGVLSAKYIAVWLVAMLTATLNIISMLATMWVFQLDKVLLSQGITVALVTQIFLLLALYALFFSAVLLVLTSVARSFKEAQAYLIPLMMFSLGPGILGMMPELGNALWLAIVPMVNLVLLARDVMQGTAEPLFATLAVVTTLLYSIAALSMAANFFGSDAVLYGSQGSWRELLRSQSHKQVPSPAFAFMVLALLFPAQFLLLGVMGRWREVWTPVQTVLAIGAATTFLFLVFPALMVSLRRYRFRETFALRWPRFTDLLGGLLLGMGAWPFVGLTLWGLGQFTQWVSGDVGSSDWTQRVAEMAVSQVQGWSQIPLPILVVTLAVVPAVCEEFFFRGLLLQSVARRTTPWRAILVSGLAFGLFHFIVESSVAPLRLFVTSIMGFILAWVCLKSNSLMPGILLHSINNGILTSLALLRKQIISRPDIQSPEAWKIAALLGVALLLVILGVWMLKRGKRQANDSNVNVLASTAMWIAITLGFSVLVLGSLPQSAAMAATGGKLHTAGPSMVSQDDLPEVAEGWTIRRFADDELAHDIHSLTVAPDGSVFVAGPGYIAQLVDSDGDGIADQRRRMAFSPKQGPQGILAEDDFLWVAVDQAIWQVSRNGGPTRQFLRLPKTGGEHDFHALRRGHDGYLYFVAGNYAQIDSSFTTNPAPIARPQHGVVGRISPDGRTRQVLVDGMRNSYDFSFGLDHSILVYDSDDERDSGLPWYRPTILYSAKEGQNVGWVSRCFKQPDGVMGNATITAETGRGSPTGVATLHRTDWGNDWLGSVAFADWTFGRVYLQNTSSTSNEAKKPVLLVSSRSGVAFAPTDLEFDGQGNLYVSVGGRDTAGAVYVIRREAETDTASDAEGTDSETNETVSAKAGEDLNFLHEVAMTQQHRLAGETLAKLATLSGDNQAAADERLLANRLLRRTIRAYALWPEVSSEQVEQLKTVLTDQNLDLDRDLAADFAVWLAMNPTSDKVSLTIAKNASVNRQVEMMACMSERQLFSIVSGNQMPASDRKLAVSALSLQRGNSNLMDNAARLLSDDLQLLIEQQPMQLAFSDWLVAMQWVLAMPVPNDGTTSPWDFMKRGRSYSSAQLAGSGLQEKFKLVWPALQSNAGYTAEEGLVFLKLGLLLGIEHGVLISQWQQWYENAKEAMDPVEKIDAFVVLAGMTHAHSQTIQDDVCDFLLGIDQELAAANISIDNNWSDRFDAIGRLLLFDANTALRFRQSDRWNRPQQIYALKLLNALDQIQPLQKMSSVWDQWPANQMSPNFLDNLASVVQQWKLNLGRFDFNRQQSIQNLMASVNVFKQRVEAQRAEYLDRLKQQLAANNPSNEATAEKVSPDELVQRVDWALGNQTRGEQLYEALNCLRCHAKAGRLGPSLAGVTRRFSKRDLVEAIVNPSSNVNDRYRSLLVQTIDGRVISGVPVYNSTDGMILEDADGKTWQLRKDQIEDSRTSDQSLMPDGLMDRVGDQDWADLFMYLEKL